MNQATASFDLSKLAALIENQMGLYFSKESWGELEKKLVPLARQQGFSNFLSFVETWSQKPLKDEQIKALALHLSIGETYFFRDQTLFRTLKELLLPRLIEAKKASRRLSIWSAACCGGEEPYSVAILLHQLLPDLANWNLKIIGTDINEHFLDRARSGLYKEWSFRGISEEIKKKYFKKTKAGEYLILPEIKKMVQFHYVNLGDQLYPSFDNGLYEMDLIFCCNVLIYFSPSQITKVVSRLAETLSVDGFLAVNAIEAPFVHEAEGKTLLTPVRLGGSTFYKRGEPLLETVAPPSLVPFILPGSCLSKVKPESAAMPILQKLPPSQPVPKPAAFKPEWPVLFNTRQYDLLIKQLEEKLQQELQPEKLQLRMEEMIFLIRAYANQKKNQEAMEWCLRALECDKLKPELYFLQAVLLQEGGDISAAIQSLKRALFLDSHFIIAHVTLGNLYQQLDNLAEANRSFRHALEILSEQPADSIVPWSDEMTSANLAEIIEKVLKNKLT